MSQSTFEYAECQIKDLKADVHETETGKKIVHTIEVDGRKFNPTQRFWTSLQARFSFSKNIFTYFSHAEVFERITTRRPNTELRLAVERSDAEEASGICGVDKVVGPKLLATTDPAKPVVQYDELLELLQNNGIDIGHVDNGFHARYFPVDTRPGMAARGTDGTSLVPVKGIDHSITPDNPTGMWRNATVGIPAISYTDGIVRSVHTPRNHMPMSIAGDDFTSKFVVDTPIDGYGKPSIYLMLLRLLCTNGAIAMSPAFRSEIALGKKEDSFIFAMQRAIEGFNNEEGFGAIKDRYEAAAKSWCSISEVTKVYKTLVKLHHRGEIRGLEKKETQEGEDAEGAVWTSQSPIIQSFNKMAGDLHNTYQLANLNGLSQKRQRTLPTGAKMYDMLNFMSEVATHHTTPAGSTMIHGQIGELISDVGGYDLEGTVTKWGDWKKFLIEDKAANEAMSIAQRL